MIDSILQYLWKKYGHILLPFIRLNDAYYKKINKYLPSVIADFVYIIPYLLVVMSVVGYFTDVKRPNSFIFLQIPITYIVFFLQYPLGFPVEVRNNIDLWYTNSAFTSGNLVLEINGICTGIFEIAFLSVLVMGFREISFRKRLKGLEILGVIVFVENIIRIFLLYPLAVYFNMQTMWNFHDTLWKFGQLVFVMILYSIWSAYVQSVSLKKATDA